MFSYAMKAFEELNSPNIVLKCPPKLVGIGDAK